MATATANRRRLLKPRKATPTAPVFHAVILSLSDSRPAECKPVRFDNGVPVYRFRKQIIRCGNFTTANGQPFAVTPAVLKMWLSDFRRMQANGVPVPVPTKHDDETADGNRGFVVEMALSNDGQGLDAIMELIGDEAPKLAASNHVSIFADPGWEDGEKNTYQWPIRHVALTPDPRITGLKGFIPLAASNHTTANIPILRMANMKSRIRKPRLHLDASDPMNQLGDGTANDERVEGDPLDMILDAIERQYLPKIREAAEKGEKVALAKEMAVKIDKALELFEEEVEEGDEDEEEGDKPGADKPDAQLCNQPNRRPAAMSNDVHPELVRLSNQNRTMQIEKLFAEKRITAHQRKELLTKFTGEGPVKLALSNTTAAATFDATIGILAANEPARVALSAAQVLPDTLKLANGSEDTETKGAIDYMRGLVGMKAK